jgi:hypothetical protein
MEALLARVHEFLAARDVALVLAIIPSPGDACGELTAIDVEEFSSYRRSGATDALAAMGARIGVPLLDLFAEFDGPECRELFLAHPDNHWSDAGQERAAKRMAEFLEADPALDPQ